MPRPPRISLPGLTCHIVQRGNDRNRTFFSDEDYRTYLLLLKRISRRYETSVHAYVLMTNHVHLLMTSKQQDGLSRTMQQVGSSYTRHVNDRYERTGTLWEGRFRSSPVDSDFYCLACYRYIELNPVRAGMVSSPGEYRWSSYNENAGRRAPSVVEPHDSFLAIASASDERASCYRAIVNDQLPDKTISAIRRATSSGMPIGDETFRKAIEQRSGTVIGRRQRGRPSKKGL